MKKINFLKRIFAVWVIAFSLIGCLAAEYKEYRFNLNDVGRGEG